MAEHGIAIVGCGVISDFHARAIGELENAKLIAVLDEVEASAKKIGEKYKVDWYTRLEELLAREDVQIVNVCTPSGVHADIAIPAAKAGKHLMVEKPIEVTLEKADRIIEACERAGVTLGVIFPSRFGEGSQLLKEAIEKGRFGRLTLGDAYVKWYRTQEYYDGGAWRGTWELDGGGALMNQSIHAVDLLQWFMGPVESVRALTATLTHERIEVEDTAVAVLRFASGALGVIEGTTSAYPGGPKTLEISGEKGTAVLKEDDLEVWSFDPEIPGDKEVRERYSRKESEATGARDPAAIAQEGHRRQIKDFLGAIETGRKPLVDGREGKKAVEIILAIYRSAREGTVVPLPLE